MASEERRNSLHCAYRLEVLRGMIGKESERLVEQARKMNGSGFVEEAERMEREVLA